MLTDKGSRELLASLRILFSLRRIVLVINLLLGVKLIVLESIRLRMS